FDKLLHSSLSSAVTFTQMDDITVIIPQYLNFNMAEVFYILFYIQTLVAKGAFGLLLRHFIVLDEFLFITGNTNTFTATAVPRFNDDGIAHCRCNFFGMIYCLDNTVTSRHRGNTCFFHGVLSYILNTHQRNRFIHRPNEYQV